MTRFVTYSAEPTFPAEDQFGAGTVREKIGEQWIDWIDERPDDDAIAARFAPPRSLVSKSVILARLTDQQLDAALAAMTNRQRERWRSPDHPAIYADDPEAVALLKAIGADPATILAP